jgi:N-methylhydantoinase B
MASQAYELTLWRNQLQGIAEEMGRSLARGAYSPNICERLDFSCALFDSQARLLAQAAHIPVHLGSLPELVEVIASYPQSAGDGWLCNDPYRGGTHLPDWTMVCPAFRKGQLIGYTAVRAHHSDVGGMSAGSMPNSQEVYQEGIILPPTRLLRKGKTQSEIWELLLANVRTPLERAGDLAAQISAACLGVERLQSLWRPSHPSLLEALLDWGEQPLRQLLQNIQPTKIRVRESIPWQSLELALELELNLTKSEVVMDWRASGPAVAAPINATRAITCAASYFPWLALAGNQHINQGSLRSLRVLTRSGSFLHAQRPFPVCAGNVETSQWICSLVWRALAQVWPTRVGASSAATMNNLSLGNAQLPFSYYETCGGGHGAHPERIGSPGQQVGMTNTRNTPAEILELYYPLRLWEYSLRQGSQGQGLIQGGLGVLRELELLAPAQATLLASQRHKGPPGLAGGMAGQPGQDRWTDPQGECHPITPPWTAHLPSGSRLRIETPGGGGWGPIA